jgi:CubicO group peptidase (beta-lactamase class C family)
MSFDRRKFLALPAAYLALRGLPVAAAPVAPAAPAAPAAPEKIPLPWPAQEWEQTTPELAGWDSGALTRARDYSLSIGTASLAVVQHGRMIASWGDIDRRLQLNSVRKSLLSALIGIAVAQRKIDLDATLASLGIDDVAPALTDIEKQATVRQLLQARSGVYHPALYETAGEKKLRPARGSHPAGTFWYYNNWDFNALGTIYERATGISIFQGFKRNIADPLGMQDYRVQDGRYVRGADSTHPAYLFHMSARDLARFGLLFLRSGRWRENIIVPSAWVKESTTAWSETYLHSGYGYMWWTGFPDRRVPIMDAAPGAYWADGHNGQYVIVDPVNDLVVVHQTATGKVTERQMGHLLWLLLNAARAGDPGRDPLAPKT